jgi:hypothetical protein
VTALRALVLAATKGTDSATGSLDVSVDGAPFTTVTLAKSDGGVMTTVDLSQFATTGSHEIALDFAGKGKLSYSLVDAYNLPWASVPADSGPVSVSVAYDKTELRLNDTVKAAVTVANTTQATENMILVTVGIPPGFAIQSEDLDAYKTAGTLSHYELTERQLTLYLTVLPPSGKAAFEYRLVATMPVTAVDGGAQAFLYYDPAKKSAAPAQQLKVTGS